MCGRIHSGDRQTSQPVVLERQVPDTQFKRARYTAAAEGRSRQLVASELQTDLQSIDGLRPHLLSSPNFSLYQSGYRTDHSTETASLKVLDGVYSAADNKQISVLIVVDLSAAFNTVDHSLPIEHMQCEFGS